VCLAPRHAETEQAQAEQRERVRSAGSGSCLSLTWHGSRFGAVQECELRAGSLSIRQVLRQRYLELPEKRFSLDGVVTEPTEPSNCFNLDGNPLFCSDNFALRPLQIGK
jgi:hypothetical protein